MSSILRIASFIRIVGLLLLASLFSAAMASPKVSQMSEKKTVTGVRVTQGNGVECPTLKTDSGDIVAIYGMPANIRLGDRVTITGTLVYPTTCIGPALNAETIERS
jgi:hypothetical protein